MKMKNFLKLLTKSDKESMLKVILILVAVSLSGCYMKTTLPKTIDCPPPEQDCRPGDWSGMPFDTSKTSADIKGWYWAIENVKQINSPDDEWGFSFIDNKLAAMTYSDFDRQNMLIARMIRPDKFGMESGMYIPKAGHIGAISLRGNKAVLASVRTEEDYLDDASEEELEEFYSRKAQENSENELLQVVPYDYLVGNSDLYTANFEGNQLKNIVSLGDKINYDYQTWESHPALSPDGNVILFSSDRPGGYGGTDIWMLFRGKNGDWSEPVNAGASINTKCDEITPFITSDGKRLLYSSSGGETVGGYDIYEAKIVNELWADAGAGLKDKTSNIDYFTSIRNIGAPLNTEADELFPSSPADPDSILYYSSNQNQGRTSIILMRGGFDIFVRYRKYPPEYLAKQKRKESEVGIDLGLADLPEEQLEDPDIDYIPFFELKGTVVNAETKQPVENASVIIAELPSKEVKEEKVTDEAGAYSVKLEKGREFEVTAQGKDLFYDSFKLNVAKEDTVTEIVRDVILPLKMELRVNFPLDNHTDPYKYVLDSNGVETNRTWQQELDKLADNIKLSMKNLEKIILVGNTDYLASVSYNNKLGQRRVDFVIRELIKRGVPEDILEGRSAGELEPLPKRPGENEKMYRKRLRRVTLEKVLKS